MTWLLREEIDTSDFQDCAVVRWPLVTHAKRLRIDLVEFDREQNVGLIWYRDLKPVSPKYDIANGTCTFFGYRWELTLVRVTHHAAELPSGLGALVGRFPDRHRGRWFVFCPRDCTASAEHREPHHLSPSGSSFVDPTPVIHSLALRAEQSVVSTSGGNGQPRAEREPLGFMVAEEKS